MTTLGPWKVDDDGSIRTTDGRDVVTAFDHRVVVSDADARLIAAAPDLLQACEAILHLKYAGPGSTALLGRAVSRARAAINKAEGKQL